MSNLEINVSSGISGTSYGLAAFYILKYMKKLGVKVNLFPIGRVSIEPFADQDYSFLMEFINNAKTFNPDAPSLRIWHQNLLGERVGRGKSFAYSFFELDPLSQADVNSINSIDCFIPSTKWAKEVCDKSGVNNTSNPCPMGIDFELVDNSQNSPTHVLKNSTFKIMHVGKLEHRKSHKEMVDAFNEAFDIFDDVQLDLYTSSFFIGQEEYKGWVDYVKSTKMGSKINIMDRINTHKNFMSLYNMYDCYASFSKAEGFDLPLMEAMAHQKLCIATNCSAHRDYITPRNCVIVPIDGMEVARDGKWFVEGDGKWAEFDFDQFIDSFNRAKDIFNGIDDNFQKNALKTAKNYDIMNTVKGILTIILKGEKSESVNFG